MAKIKLTPMPLAAMQTEMGNPGFAGLVAGELGTDGTAADGFDALVAALINQVGAELSLGPYLDSLILAADFSGDSVYSPQWSDAVSSFQALSAVGDNILNTTLGVLATANGPAPAPPTPTPLPPPVVTAPVHGPGNYFPPPPVVFIPPGPFGPVVPGDYCAKFHDDTDLCPSEQ